MTGDPKAAVQSALTGLETAIGLVDHIGATTTTDHSVVAMAPLERFERVTDLHGANAALSETVVAKERPTYAADGG